MLSDDGLEWGYVAISGDNLFGSTPLDDAHYTNIWCGSSTGWYDPTSGDATHKVCSQCVFAYDKDSGSRIWTDNGPERAVSDRLYFGSSVTDSVHCLDAHTGQQQWFFTTKGPVRYPPSYDNGKLYFGSDDGYAYCIDASDGSFIWKHNPSEDSRLIGNNGSLISMWPISPHADSGRLCSLHRSYKQGGCL